MNVSYWPVSESTVFTILKNLCLVVLSCGRLNYLPIQVFGMDNFSILMCFM